jgi:sulfonate transport system substrate-binding protein
VFNRLSTAFASLAAAALVLSGCVAGEGPASSPNPTPSGGEDTTQSASLDVLRLDYAYWNPLSLVIRDQGWLESDLAEQGIGLEWIQSAGSNVALQNLNARAIDIASSAGSAVFAARANGAPVKTIGVFSQPFWASIVVPAGSDIQSVADLEGRSIAATSGTDPYFFLLQALATAGLSTSDVEVVNLAHAEGQRALEGGDVEAWAGLDPLTATSERTAGSQVIYSNPDFNTWGVLSVDERFLDSHPDVVLLVLENYERARQWILDNPDAAVDILASEASLDRNDAAKVLLERTRIDVSLVPGSVQRSVFEVILPVLVAEGGVRSEDSGLAALDELIDDTYAKRVVGK